MRELVFALEYRPGCNRVVSRLHASARIRFRRYGTDELVAILRDRARWGLRENAVGTEGLRRVAEAAAGDARIAIAVLRAAARAADKSGLDAVTNEVIDEVVPEARAEIRQAHVQRLTDDQRVLCDIVVDRGRGAPGELYEAYCERVDDPKTRRMVRNHLQKMQQYDLVRAAGESRDRTYHPQTR